MTTIQDIICGQYLIEEYFSEVNEDKTTKICASDIGQFLGEYYGEMFEGIASDENKYDRLCVTLRYETNYFSYGWIAAEHLANNGNLNNYSPFNTIAQFYGYESYDEFTDYAFIISDTAIDGFLVFY